jgi:beta-aspartyl-peptidase (threonine type)
MRAMGPDKERAYRAGLSRATTRGALCLAEGGAALDAATAAVAEMEASGDFNAGLGSCLNLEGHVEADAAVMRGRDLDYGAVAAVPHLGNAVEMADAVRRHSPHCMLAGPAALRAVQGWSDFQLRRVTPSSQRRARWTEMKAEMPPESTTTDTLTQLGGTHDDGDTVGAVVLDGAGHLAAAVSTGGLWLKAPGRVGDSPIAGSGLWAEDGVVACSATGTGEFIMRTGLCADVRARVQSGDDALTACREALAALATRFGLGRAGLIAVDAQGRIAAPFDTAGMGRGWMRAGDTAPTVRIWPEEGAP